MQDDPAANYCNSLLSDDSTLDWGRSEEDEEQSTDESSGPQLGAIFSTGAIWQCLKTFVVVTTGVEGSITGIYLVLRGQGCCYPSYNVQDGPP